jgi:glycosyltransferase involved in cell wall biosynthesis
MLNKNPLFSILIPTFNREKILPIAVESVLNQTFSDFELIIVDNGSTDNTKKVIEDYSDERIKYYWQNGSGSPANPRNTGITIAKGEWICFLDSDDSWNKNKLRVISEYISKNNHYDIICHHMNVQTVNQSRSVIRFAGATGKVSNKNMILLGNPLINSATIVRNEFIIKNSIVIDERKEFIGCEDWELWLQCASKNARFKIINQILGTIFMIDDRVTLSIDNKKNATAVIRHHCYNVQKFTEFKKLLFIRAQSFIGLSDCMDNLRKRNYVAFSHGFFKTIIINPAAVYYLVKNTNFWKRMRIRFLDVLFSL